MAALPTFAELIELQKIISLNKLKEEAIPEMRRIVDLMTSRFDRDLQSGIIQNKWTVRCHTNKYINVCLIGFYEETITTLFDDYLKNICSSYKIEVNIGVDKIEGIIDLIVQIA